MSTSRRDLVLHFRTPSKIALQANPLSPPKKRISGASTAWYPYSQHLDGLPKKRMKRRMKKLQPKDFRKA